MMPTGNERQTIRAQTGYELWNDSGYSRWRFNGRRQLEAVSRIGSAVA